jgi:hypothetical protein
MHSHECTFCRKKFDCPFLYCEEQRRKLCDECSGQAESVVASIVATEWAREGQLVFRRHPNYLGIVVAVLLIGLAFSLVLDFGFGPSLPRAIFGWLIILFCVGYIPKGIRWRNRIVLTQTAFEEHNRRGFFGRKRQINIPWERVEASETTTAAGTSAGKITGRAEIKIEDKSTSFYGMYSRSTTSDYNVFRSALVSRVGLRAKRIEYREV